jgi:hypothetical protein
VDPPYISKPLAAWESTVTVALAVTEPEALVAVKVYAVVTVGETVLEARLVTSPTELSMDIVEALATVQDRTVERPEVTEAGAAVKAVIVGGEAETDVVVKVASLDTVRLPAADLDWTT